MFNWVPPTGNLMYMMPQAGTLKCYTRVSLYFKGDQETSAVAVNCIRSGCGCEEADYHDKGLVTEHEMELRLHQSEIGLATKNGNNLLLKNGNGIELTGTQDFKIVAAGNIRLEGKNIRLEGPGGVNSYQGYLQVKEADSGSGTAQVMAKNVPLVGNGGGEGSAGASEPEEPEMELEVIIEAKIELLEGDEGQEADSRGSEKTYYLAWEHEDLKHPSNRYRDMPEEQGRDWAGLVNNVIGGLALAAGTAALAYAAPYALAGTKIGAAVLNGLSAGQAGTKLGLAVFLAGSMNAIGLGVSDFMGNRVSSREEYLRRAMAGAVSGFLSGASTLMLADAGLAAVMGGGFAEGFVSEAIAQKLLNDDGSIQWGLCFSSGILNAFLDGKLAGTIGNTVEYDELLKHSGLTNNQLDDVLRYTNQTPKELLEAIKDTNLADYLNGTTVEDILKKHGLKTVQEAWTLEGRERGNLIEELLAHSEYSDWWHCGAEWNGYFPVIDFSQDGVVVSLKTMDPTLPSYVNGRGNKIIEDYIDKLAKFKYEADVKILDVRVPRGTIGVLDRNGLMTYANAQHIILKIREY